MNKDNVYVLLPNGLVWLCAVIINSYRRSREIDKMCSLLDRPWYQFIVTSTSHSYHAMFVSTFFSQLLLFVVVSEHVCSTVRLLYPPFKSDRSLICAYIQTWDGKLIKASAITRPNGIRWKVTVE